MCVFSLSLPLIRRLAFPGAFLKGNYISRKLSSRRWLYSVHKSHQSFKIKSMPQRSERRVAGDRWGRGCSYLSWDLQLAALVHAPSLSRWDSRSSGSRWQHRSTINTYNPLSLFTHTYHASRLNQRIRAE